VIRCSEYGDSEVLDTAATNPSKLIIVSSVFNNIEIFDVGVGALAIESSTAIVIIGYCSPLSASSLNVSALNTVLQDNTLESIPHSCATPHFEYKYY
jgi:hypothetical protein